MIADTGRPARVTGSAGPRTSETSVCIRRWRTMNNR
jgi:hypothetical protein